MIDAASKLGFADFHRFGSRAGAMTSVLPWLAAGVMLVSGQADAQAVVGADILSDDDAIIVTARKREESLKDVPVSVTALGAEQLDRLNVSSGQNLAARVPNLYITGNPYFSSSLNFTIRGVGAKTPLEPAVAVFLDGVYMPSLGWDLGFLELERVEVLRGPQGTLFGRNTQAGAINIISRKPGDNPYGQVRFEADEFNTIKVSGGIGGPISDTVSASISALAEQTDGYIRNVTIGNDLLARSRFGGRFQLVARPTERFSAVLSIDGVFEEGGFYGSGAPLQSSPKAIGRWKVRYDVDQHEKIKNYGAGLNLDYDFDGTTLSSITGYRQISMQMLADIDGIDTPDLDGQDTIIVPKLAGRDFPVPNQNYLFGLRDQRILSQELRLASSGNGEFQWLIGAYAFTENNDGSRNFPVPDSYVYTNSSNLVIDDVDMRRKGYSLFAQANYALTPRLELSGGLRYAYEKVDQDLAMDFTIGGGVLSGTFAMSPSQSYKDVSPMASVRYRWSDDVMTYVTVAKGFKGGGFNLSAPTNPLANLSFSEESSWSYEAGAKLSLFDNRLSIDAALFRIDIKDMQVSLQRQVNSAFSVGAVGNAAAARSKGFELEITARPVPALRLSASAGYTDATYRNYINEALIDMSGEPIEDIPDWLLNLGAEYRIPVAGDLEVMLGANYRYVGEARYGNGTPSTPHFEVPSYDQVDLRAGLDNGNWNLTAFVDNVFNQYNVIWRGGFSTFYRRPTEAFGERAAPPRRIGLKGTYRF